MDAIVGSRIMRPSRAHARKKDVRYGNGQYFTDIVPGSMSASQLSRAILGMPFQGHRFTHFVAINLHDVNVVECRRGVFLVPNDFALSLINRIVDYGRVRSE